MRFKNEPYQCTRCGYSTDHRSKMHKHLFGERKKPCPTTLNDIELTDSIKQHIIDFRVYHIPKQVLQTINNFNQQNIICGLDTMEKINAIMSYHKQDIIGIQQQISSRFSSNVMALEAGERLSELKMGDFYVLVDSVSDVYNGNLEEFNIFYDEKVNKIALFESGMWEKLLYKNGVTKLIRNIQYAYLNAYETHLIKKIEYGQVSYQEQARLSELLHEYYKFLSAFGLKPQSVACHDDSDLVGIATSRGSYDIKDKFTSKFCKISENMKQAEITKIGKEILDILKRNSKRNIEDLNKKMMSLFILDDEFKTTITKLAQVV